MMDVSKMLEIAAPLMAKEKFPVEFRWALKPGGDPYDFEIFEVSTACFIFKLRVGLEENFPIAHRIDRAFMMFASRHDVRINHARNYLEISADIPKDLINEFNKFMNEGLQPIAIFNILGIDE